LAKPRKLDFNSEKEVPAVENSETNETHYQNNADSEINPIEKTDLNLVNIKENIESITEEQFKSKGELKRNENGLNCIIGDGTSNTRKPRLRKRNVISAITRKTNSTARTRPSTACANFSRRTANQGGKHRNFKLSSVISEKVRVKSGKRRPKTGVNSF